MLIISPGQIFAQKPGFETDASPGEWFSKHKQVLADQLSRISKPGQAENDKSRRIDARYCRLEVAPDYASRTISGRMLGTFVSLTDGLDTARLDMSANLAVQNTGGDVQSYSRAGDFIYVKLNRTVSKDEIFTIDLSYSGSSYNPIWGGMAFDIMPDGSEFVWTFAEPYGARNWWPCHDVPADKIDSMDIIVAVPADQVVGSNGKLLSVTAIDVNIHTFHWQVSHPISAYLVSVVAGQYAHFQDYYHYSANDSMLLDYYVFPEQEVLGRSLFAEMSDYLNALTHFFGPYPFLDEKYGMAQYKMRGAMEHQTLTSIRWVDASWRYVYVHELGHQWFGDQVTCASWTDIWLNEGFASYSEALYAEWAGYDGHPPGEKSLHAYMATQQFFEEGKIAVSDTGSFSSIFGLIVYDKGSWVLHMLRHVMGDESFFKALKNYLNDPRWTYGAVSTNNFQEVCENVSGLDLSNFFDQWLNYEYYPAYQYYWNLIGAQNNAYTAEVGIRQEQLSTLYAMPVDLTFTFSDSSDTTITIHNSLKEERYTLSLHHKPVKLLFDRDNWILKNAAEIPPEAMAGNITIREIFPNPFNENASIRVINLLSTPLDLQIIDILGREVRRLQVRDVNGFNFLFSWDGRNQQGNRVASGVYFIRPLAQKNSVSLVNNGRRKIVVLR
jgi:hypothetical protein